MGSTEYGMKNKYFAHKVTTAFGTFDSRLEMRRFLYLKDLESKGKISNLRKQVTYEIIPKQTYIEVVQLKTKTKKVEKVLEQPAEDTADFVYKLPDGTEIVEDVKSKATREARDYPLRRKLMRLHGYMFYEVSNATDPIPTNPKVSVSTDILLTNCQ